jgi:hypothetical protein
MKLIIGALFLAFPILVQAEWNVDLSRRTKELQKIEKSQPVETQKSEGSFFDLVVERSEPVQEIVILNTDKGFVPSTVRVRESQPYKIHIVNVNEKERNVSFVMDAFSEHHATYYGKIKTFVIQPQKEGIYTFQSPETTSQGRLVVLPGAKTEGLNARKPASE